MRSLASLVLYVAAGTLATAVAVAALGEGGAGVAGPLLAVLAGLSLLLGYARPLAAVLGPPLLVCVLAAGLFGLTGIQDADTLGWGAALLVIGLVAGEACVLVGALAGGIVRGARRVLVR